MHGAYNAEIAGSIPAWNIYFFSPVQYLTGGFLRLGHCSSKSRSSIKMEENNVRDSDYYSYDNDDEESLRYL